MIDQQIDAAQLRQLLTYDALSGEFVWLVATRNGKGQPGCCAGRVNDQGYFHIGIFGRNYKSHRLAWLYVYGEWPERDLDHINGDRADNRIANLRLATRAQNAANKRRHRTNFSGFKGVSFHPKTKKWRAIICQGGHSFHLGLFESKEEAHAAYCYVAKERFDEFWRAE